MTTRSTLPVTLLPMLLVLPLMASLSIAPLRSLLTQLLIGQPAVAQIYEKCDIVNDPQSCPTTITSTSSRAIR